MKIIVKPFVRRQKNEGNDAETFCTAARQPHIPFVPKKTIAQQDIIQALHRARQRKVNHRTAVVSHPTRSASWSARGLQAQPIGALAA